MPSFLSKKKKSQPPSWEEVIEAHKAAKGLLQAYREVSAFEAADAGIEIRLTTQSTIDFADILNRAAENADRYKNRKGPSSAEDKKAFEEALHFALESYDPNHPLIGTKKAKERLINFQALQKMVAPATVASISNESAAKNTELLAKHSQLLFDIYNSPTTSNIHHQGLSSESDIELFSQMIEAANKDSLNRPKSTFPPHEPINQGQFAGILEEYKDQKKQLADLDKRAQIRAALSDISIDALHHKNEFIEYGKSLKDPNQKEAFKQMMEVAQIFAPSEDPKLKEQKEMRHKQELQRQVTEQEQGRGSLLAALRGSSRLNFIPRRLTHNRPFQNRSER